MTVCLLTTLILTLVHFSRATLTKDAEYPGILNCSKPGLVALTFDDGPSPNGGTQEVLKVLRDERVKATFFVTGKGWDSTFLDSDPRKQSLLRQIHEEGHQIGSHTWSHSSLIKNRTKEQIHQDVSRLAKTVYNILRINMTIIRAPYGTTNEFVTKYIYDEFGYQMIRWNLDTKDWYHGKNVEASFKKYEDELESGLNTTSSFITLHHDPAPGSGELARKAIGLIREKGFRLVTVAECIGVSNYA